jgi:cyclic beta-1,2-glucan synthetase
LRLGAALRGQVARVASDRVDEPIRGPLFSLERLEEHAQSLAAAQTVTRDSRIGRSLMPRLLENERVMLRAYNAITAAVRESRTITPAAEWLIDNHHVLDEQIREVRHDLPLGYYRQLPKLEGGHLRDYPRVYGLAWNYVAHLDSRFDPEALSRFVRAYQRVAPLSTGELWAIAIHLRLVLVENLRRLSDWVAMWLRDRQEADALADRLLGLSGGRLEARGVALRWLDRQPFPRAFAVQLVQRLRDQDPAVIPALGWLLERLKAEGVSADELVSLEHQRQAATNITVSNIITSMRAITAFDWAAFVENMSLIDQVLGANSAYAALDFETRDQYRHAIEELAKGSRRTEVEVARVALSLTEPDGPRGLEGQSPENRGHAATAMPVASPRRRADPGFWLISRGRATLERELKFRPPLTRWVGRAYLAFATPGYLGTILVVTVTILALALWLDWRSGAGVRELVLLGVFALIPASDLAIPLVNRYVMAVVPPRLLPKLDLGAGVPESLRTLIVIPAMLSSEAEVAELLERLEMHHLANPEGDLGFALLTDWPDAPAETMPDDARLLELARAGIVALNARHGPMMESQNRFLLYHRKRLWNPAEGCWMGWERKRGKLTEFNRLLRDADDTSFVPIGSEGSKVPERVRYVITLDADTLLPRGAAARLVGAMAHPLNRPRLDPHSRRVVEGYGVLQPRITPSLPAEGQDTVFRRLSSGPAGLDPYATAVSDVYQDVFGEGSFTGKGIYDVDAFAAALEGRVPENTLLSHDLFEGVFARCGLVTDIELVEASPARYEVHAARTHRWVRGDWQLLSWLASSREPIPVIDRWKMLDNLRRSLSPIAAWLTLLAAWTLPLSTSTVWIGFVVSSIVVPPLIPALADVAPRRGGISRRAYFRRVLGDLGLAVTRLGLALAMLSHQAWLMGDAILRTLARLVTRRHLLEWRTAAWAAAHPSLEWPETYRRMFGAPLLAVVAGGVAVVFHLEHLARALPFLLVWAASPAIALWVSRPLPALPLAALSSGEGRWLRQVARRTWRYFEYLVGPEDHFLPPDNMQEEPRPVVAHRTSPTNVGVYLLSTVAAHDFGWIGLVETLERLEATVQTLEGLEKFQGHLFNWYDTRSLDVLAPRYVSTVDSGNLVGHLIALEQCLLEFSARPASLQSRLAGVQDALGLVRERIDQLATWSGGVVTRRDFEASLKALEAELQAFLEPAALGAAGGHADAPSVLHALLPEAETLLDIAHTLIAATGANLETEVLTWVQAVHDALRSHMRDLEAGVLERHPESDPEASAPEVSGARPSAALVDRISRLSARVRALHEAMGFGFLYDPTRKLFSIGYDANSHRLDSGVYDLLASEARLTSFIAVTRGEVPTAHWFRLGRALTPVGRGSALVSWSGSMFEYLMPALVMRSPEGSLLETTYRQVVARQIGYGRERGVPWGVSESAFASRDLEQNYQYAAFGVPGLGLKRGLADELVIAPYATALAAMVNPVAAARNLSTLAALGALGRYGFCDALDYTARRVPPEANFALVQNYMAHHQGMSVIALANALFETDMPSRFSANPGMHASELLLHERHPLDAIVARPPATELEASVHVRESAPPAMRRYLTLGDGPPATQLLSNGRYAVMLTAAGSGYSLWNGLAVTRWREDATRDTYGSYIFVRDAQGHRAWSATHQPMGELPSAPNGTLGGTPERAFEVNFTEDRARFFRRDGDLASTLQVIVSPEDDAEVRRIAITNLGAQPREIELTSYAEIVLAPGVSDAAHPAFAKLFVQTEFVPSVGALLATRRPRSSDEPRVWAAHVVAVEGETVGALQFETDRARFLGRGCEIRQATALTEGRPLSGTVGAVLDPVFSLRRRVRIAPGAVARVSFTTLIAPTREEALDLIDKYRDPATFARELALAWTQAQMELRHLSITPDEAHWCQELASRLLYIDPALRAAPEALERNRLGQPGLWRHGISGDLPMLLVRVGPSDDPGLVRQLLRAFQYWRRKRLEVDLVILNDQPPSYAQETQSGLEALVRLSEPGSALETPALRGGVFVLRGDQLSPEDLDLISGVARVVLYSRHGNLAEQLERLQRRGNQSRPRPALRRSRPMNPVPSSPTASAPRPALEFFNGLGGFSAHGREYVIVLGEGQWTPAPWINVIANPGFGCQVSESGAGYAWAVNSREHKLSPWSNDPVTDGVGEAIYVRDDETGELFGPTALPIREAAPYVVRHGQGYSRFEHDSHGLALELTPFVPPEDPVRVSRLRLENRSGRARRLTVTAYTEWVLGVSREVSAPFVVTERDPDTGALLARNSWNPEFADRVAFAHLSVRGATPGPRAWTADRTEFLGRRGSLERPAALEPGANLSGRVGAGLDACTALQVSVDLPVGARVEVIALLGDSAGREDAIALIERHRATDPEVTLEAVRRRWDETLGVVQVRTPDRGLDLLINRWLPYQTLASRIWARTAFYQAGGAYGFRDQLQDVMALTLARPEIARAQILLAARHQFLEGDVQHWWHPPSGRGVRTRISDDRWWFPYVTSHYLEVTGDTAILEEIAPFIEGPPLEEGHEDAYFEPRVSDQVASLYEHAARAIDASLKTGPHGIPLIGSGDWNDGMNRVGQHGRGESVWLGWFQLATLPAWIEIARTRGDAERAKRWADHAERVRLALERDGWDGDWYRRAFFDDGTPLGSASNEECRIDAIAQSWAAISGAAQPARAAQAMLAVDQSLVRRGDGLVLLFTPPFDKSERDPGYIKGYLPGVRENGGQYTHAAIWTVIAFAVLGDGDKAGELLSILNPISQTSTRAGVHRYKAEPYVLAADVYAEPPHVGRGGWTWYTGSGGWMYRAGLEWLLGLRVRGDRAHLEPCIPRTWPRYAIHLRRGAATYEITVENPRGVNRGVTSLELDGVSLEGSSFELRDDGQVHRVHAVLG